MATDAFSLLAAGRCDVCYAPNQYSEELIKIALLRQIALSLNPSADVSPQTLLSEASCYICFGSSVYALSALQLVLLKIISQSGGAGGDVQRVFFGSFGDPNGNQTANGDAVYYDTNGSFWAHYSAGNNNTNWFALLEAPPP